MTAQPPLEPDEILTADGVRVQLRPPRDAGARSRRAPSPAALLALAAVPVVLPLAAAGAAALVGAGMAAAGAGLARSLLSPAAPRTPGGDGWPAGVRVTVIVVEQRWSGR